MSEDAEKVVGFAVEQDSLLGGGGYLAVRRMQLRNLRADGSQSRPYACHFLVRASGPDAVVVGLFHRKVPGVVHVLLREGLRPALAMGRSPETLPVPDPRPYRYFTEVVAGVIESGDLGEEGIRRRALLEIEEETGYQVPPEALAFLGAGTFPSPGSMPEKFWLVAAEVQDPHLERPAAGDGSPMEEGSRKRWLPLEDAIAACVRGDIEDAKTEIVLRRLRDALATSP